MPKNLFTDYEGFVEKFQPKKTTDDCYTPQPVYEAILEWCRDNLDLPEGARILRPFKPGGDYQSEEYLPNDAVIDNPPFSILSQIVNWYCEKGIRFFLFAPSLTLFGLSKDRKGVTSVVASLIITYENGAIVRTSFVTNMLPGDYAFVCAGDLHEKVQVVCDQLASANKAQVTKRSYPNHIVSAALLGKVVERGVSFKVRHSDCTFIRKLDTQSGGIFGGGYLMSDRAAADRAAADRAAADRAAADRAAAELIPKEVAELSEREKKIIQILNRQAQ